MLTTTCQWVHMRLSPPSWNTLEAYGRQTSQCLTLQEWSSAFWESGSTEDAEENGEANEGKDLDDQQAIADAKQDAED